MRIQITEVNSEDAFTSHPNIIGCIGNFKKSRDYTGDCHSGDFDPDRRTKQGRTLYKQEQEYGIFFFHIRYRKL